MPLAARGSFGAIDGTLVPGRVYETRLKRYRKRYAPSTNPRPIRILGKWYAVGAMSSGIENPARRGLRQLC
jgi:hypothetical protein